MSKILRRAALLLAVGVTVAGCGGGGGSTTSSTSPPQAPVQSGSFGGRTHSQAFLNSAHNPTGLKFPPPTAAAPQLSGYDAVTASAVPFGAQVALCYANGTYANCGAVAARHPKHLVPIAVRSYAVGRLLDDEPGDATPSEAGPWVKAMIVQHHIFRPGVYASLSNMPAVEASIRAQGLARSQYVLMVAAWDGNPRVPAGFDAKQYRSTTALDYDSFLVSFFNRPKPAPKPVRCYHHGWAQPRTKANEALCNRVRKHDSFLGVVVKHEDSYLSVTNHNLAVTRRQIAALQKREAAQAGRQSRERKARDSASTALQADLKKYGFTG